MKCLILANLACDAVSIRGTASDGAGPATTTATTDARGIDAATAAILNNFYPGPDSGTYVIRGNSLRRGIIDQEEVCFFYPDCGSGDLTYVLESQIVSETVLHPCGGLGETLVELVVSY
jgi:hypothetical protein